MVYVCLCTLMAPATDPAYCSPATLRLLARQTSVLQSPRLPDRRGDWTLVSHSQWTQV
jgi:hypothetical protein